MKPAYKKKLTYFIGVDVSRNKLDFAIRNSDGLLFHREVANEKSQIILYISELKNLEKFSLLKALFCMEDSGYYVNHLLGVLNKARTNIHLGNPTHIKNSLGLVRDKSDRLDAIRIANYAYRYHDELRLWKPKRKEINQLAAFATVRNRMITTLGMIKIPLKDQRSYIDQDVHKQVVDCCKKSLASLTEDINLLEKSMLNLVRSDSKLNRYYEIICSVPYVGPVTAIQIIICTNEFLDINCPRKFASYAGVAPYNQESGIMTGKTHARISKIANQRIKTLLHICAVGGIRRHGEFRDYYNKRVGEGKLPLSVVNAIRNKIIRRIFSCIKHDRLYLSAVELNKLQCDILPKESSFNNSQLLKKTRNKFANRTLGKPLY